jgi:predicted PurR-regulated permease PerM
LKPLQFLLILLAAILIALFNIFSPFLKPILVAFLLSVATGSIHTHFKGRFSSQSVFSTFMTAGLALLFLAPFFYFIITISSYINTVDKQEFFEFFNYIKLWINNIPDDFILVKTALLGGLNQIDVANFIQKLISVGAYIGKNSATFLFDMVMILIFYFIFNYYARPIGDYFKSILPLRDEDSESVFFEITNVTSVVFYSILVTAIFEGILFGGFIHLFGYDGIMFGILYGFASLVPVVGGMLMWLPLFAYEAFIGEVTNGIIIVVYTIVVISFLADTIIKPIIIKYINKKVIKTPTTVNELLIFFSIIAGLSTVGFWGMIIGPASVTFCISILRLFKEYKE